MRHVSLVLALAFALALAAPALAGTGTPNDPVSEVFKEAPGYGPACQPNGCD